MLEIIFGGFLIILAWYLSYVDNWLADRRRNEFGLITYSGPLDLLLLGLTRVILYFTWIGIGLVGVYWILTSSV